MVPYQNIPIKKTKKNMFNKRKYPSYLNNISIKSNIEMKHKIQHVEISHSSHTEETVETVLVLCNSTV